MAARALFAFQIGASVEVDGAREPTSEALLGALLHAEERAVTLQFAENFAQFVETWMKVQKARGRRK